MAAFQTIITVGLNPTVDRVIDVSGFAVGETVQGRLRSLTAAGKAFNVSLALAELGVASTAAGFMGGDTRELFEGAARESGVVPRFTSIAGQTRQNLTILDPRARSETHIRDVGPTVTEDDIVRLMSDLLPLCRPGVAVVFSGSLPPGVSAPRFGQILDACVAAGAAVVVDSSGAALREAAGRKLWLIKPNEVELAELLAEDRFTGEAEIVAAGRRLNERVPVVLITLGERGAYCFGEGQAWHAAVSLRPEDIRSVTGCGDVLLAGFLAAASRGETLGEALRQAVAVAAAAALTEQPAQFSAEVARELAGSVTLKTVSE